MSDATRDQVRSFLIGCLLGDSHANAVTCQWHWGNVDRQYVEWKAAFVRRHLGLRCNVWIQKDPSCKDGFMYCFTAASKKGRLRIYREWFHNKHGRKCITGRIRHLDHPLGLVTLILDQGSCRGGVTTDSNTGNPYYRKPTVRIHLNAHSEGELMLFQASLLENFELETTLQRKAGGHLDVYFSTKQTQRLWKILQPHLPELAIVKRKFHPLISQTTNAHLIQRDRGVRVDGGESRSSKASLLHCGDGRRAGRGA